MKLIRRHLAELAALPLLPLLILQGRHARRVTPRLPEATGPTAGLIDAGTHGTPLSLLTLGESPVAGVGVRTHEEAITGQLALALSVAMQCSVRWQACGKNGITAAEALEQLVPAMPKQAVDVLAIAFGVNDTTAFRSHRRWSRDLYALWRAAKERCHPGLIIVCGVPPVGSFPALPQPLRQILGWKAQALDLVARELAATLPDTLYVPVTLDPTRADWMASDGYHPSAAGCTAWAAAIAQLCAARHRDSLCRRLCTARTGGDRIS